MRFKVFQFNIFVLCFSLVQGAYAAQALDSIAATVNDEAISNSFLQSQVKILKFNVRNANILPPKHELDRQVLEKIISDKIQLQHAKKARLEVMPQEITAMVEDQAKSRGLTTKGLKDALKTAGITYKDYVDLIKEEILIQQLHQREVIQDVAVSNSEIESFLNSPEGQDQTGTEYELGHILLVLPEAPSASQLEAKRKEAVALVATLRQGADFSKTAMAKSSDRFAMSGGNLGWKKVSEVPTLFVKHVPSMQPGEILEPVQSSSGFHILKLLNKRIGKETMHVETRVRQILIKPSVNISSEEAKENLLKFKSQIEAGTDFAKLAEKSSEELASASKGGDLGWLTKDQVLPLFYKKMNKLKVNEISEPFETSLGWHLIQVIGRRDQSTSAAAARNKAHNIVFQRKATQMLEVWLKRIRDEAKVAIF